MGGERKEIKTMSKVYIPEDVIFNVLSRLPVRTLLKLRCVSKSWAHLIYSPEFIESHLNLSLTDSKSRKFIFETRPRRPFLFQFGISFKFLPENFNSLQNSDDDFDYPSELYCPESIYDQEKRLIGSSRGLICIRYDEYGAFLSNSWTREYLELPRTPQCKFKESVCLCNPWTRKYKELPRIPLEIFPRGMIWIHTNYGFGYDDIHDDYKVVRLVQLQNETSQKFCNKVQIYSLKSNKWKSAENFPHATDYGACGVVLNHTLHWILRHQESISVTEEFILAMDLRTEEYQFLLLPDDFKRYRTAPHWILGASDGTLCVSRGDSVGFEIWLMKDYGIRDSWTKLRVDILGLNCSIANLVRYSEPEKQLIFSHTPTRFCRYDIEKKILYERENNPRGNIFCTVESLVPLINGGRRFKCRKIEDSKSFIMFKLLFLFFLLGLVCFLLDQL